MAAAVTGLSPVTMTVLMPIARRAGETLLDVGFHGVFEMDDAEQALVFGDGQRRATRPGDPVDGRARKSVGPPPSARPTLASTESTAPFAQRAGVQVYARHAGLGRERHNRRANG